MCTLVASLLPKDAIPLFLADAGFGRTEFIRWLQKQGFANGSYYYIGTAGGRQPFRGDTCRRVHGSEVAFWCEGPHQVEDQERVIAAIEGAADSVTSGESLSGPLEKSGVFPPAIIDGISWSGGTLIIR